MIDKKNLSKNGGRNMVMILVEAEWGGWSANPGPYE